MREWSSDRVSANGMSFHYTRTGGDKPPLVLMHGMTDNGLCWSRLARALEGQYDVIMPDARSHGSSQRSSGHYSCEAQAADLAGIVEGLHLECPAIAGHSMGAMTTTFFAASYPHLLSAAILEDPPWQSNTPVFSMEEHTARLDERRRAFARDAASGRDALLARGRRNNPLWGAVEFEPWADAKMAVDTDAAPELSEDDPWRDSLPQISCPTLLITGDSEKGAIVTPEVAQECVELQPRLTVAHIAGAGHSVRRERFDAYLEVVTAFLAEHTVSAPLVP